MEKISQWRLWIGHWWQNWYWEIRIQLLELPFKVLLSLVTICLCVPPLWRHSYSNPPGPLGPLPFSIHSPDVLGQPRFLPTCPLHPSPHVVSTTLSDSAVSWNYPAASLLTCIPSLHQSLTQIQARFVCLLVQYCLVGGLSSLWNNLDK